MNWLEYKEYHKDELDELNLRYTEQELYDKYTNMKIKESNNKMYIFLACYFLLPIVISLIFYLII